MHAPKSIILLVCLFVMLAGCGGPTGTTATTGTAVSGEQPATTARTSGGTTAVSPATEPATTGVSRRTAWTVTVTEVVDGDTMDVRFENGTTETVRLLGVDTPEVYGENDPSEFEGIPDSEAGEEWLAGWGENASEFARTELAGETVTISLDPRADRRGSYGRLLAYVRVNGTLFNRQLLTRGYARFYDAPLTRADEFERYEARARRNDTGLWGFDRAM